MINVIWNYIFTQPCEQRQINISDPIYNIISNKLLQQNHTMYHSTNEDTIKYKWNNTDRFTSALIVEELEMDIVLI